MHILFKIFLAVTIIGFTLPAFAEDTNKGRGSPDVKLPSTGQPKTGEKQNPPKESESDRKKPPERRD